MSGLVEMGNNIHHDIGSNIHHDIGSNVKHDIGSNTNYDRDCGGMSICIYMSIKLLLLRENKGALGTRKVK